MTKFNGICIITEDVARLRDFYSRVLQAGAEGDIDYAAFSLAGAALSIFAAHRMEEMASGATVGAGRGGVALEFEVADVDAEHRRLVDMGVPILKPPTTQPWGWRSVWFRDPDGNIVNFCAYVGDQE